MEKPIQPIRINQSIKKKLQWFRAIINKVCTQRLATIVRMNCTWCLIQDKCYWRGALQITPYLTKSHRSFTELLSLFRDCLLALFWRWRIRRRNGGKGKWERWIQAEKVRICERAYQILKSLYTIAENAFNFAKWITFVVEKTKFMFFFF